MIVFWLAFLCASLTDSMSSTRELIPLGPLLGSSDLFSRISRIGTHQKTPLQIDNLVSLDQIKPGAQIFRKNIEFPTVLPVLEQLHEPKPILMELHSMHKKIDPSGTGTAPFGPLLSDESFGPAYNRPMLTPDQASMNVVAAASGEQASLPLYGSSKSSQALGQMTQSLRQLGNQRELLQGYVNMAGETMQSSLAAATALRSNVTTAVDFVMANKEQLLAWVRSQKEGVLQQLDAQDVHLKSLAGHISEVQAVLSDVGRKADAYRTMRSHLVTERQLQLAPPTSPSVRNAMLPQAQFETTLSQLNAYLQAAELTIDQGKSNLRQMEDGYRMGLQWRDETRARLQDWLLQCKGLVVQELNKAREIVSNTRGQWAQYEAIYQQAQQLKSQYQTQLNDIDSKWLLLQTNTASLASNEAIKAEQEKRAVVATIQASMAQLQQLQQEQASLSQAVPSFSHSSQPPYLGSPEAQALAAAQHRLAAQALAVAEQPAINTLLQTSNLPQLQLPPQAPPPAVSALTALPDLASVTAPPMLADLSKHLEGPLATSSIASPLAMQPQPVDMDLTQIRSGNIEIKSPIDADSLGQLQKLTNHLSLVTSS